MRKLSRRARRYWLPLFYLAFVNFAAFAVVAARLGGDAVSGKVESGRYYLSSHGVRTEVSRAVYNYSLVHTVSTWITHGLALVGVLSLYAVGQLYEPRPEAGAASERDRLTQPLQQTGSTTPAPTTERGV